MNKSKLKFLWALVVIAITGNAYQAAALPNAGVAKKPTAATSNGVLKGTAALCDPATATVDLDINNVRARMMNGGDMWWDRATATARYEVPKGSGKHALYSGSVWVGGYDVEGNLKVCAQTYRQSGNDYWPGPLNISDNSIDKATCSEWDKIWRINKSDLYDFLEAIKSTPAANLKDNPKFQDIVEWPALGNNLAEGKSNLPLNTLIDAVGVPNHTYAPFVDYDGDGLYNPDKGDYPDILGDQYTWWVFNDVGNAKTETGSQAIGMEIQTSAFAFSRKDYMNDATFINYRLINRGNLTMGTTYMSTWTDADLGYAYDDYIGCDTSRGLGILYNSKVPDGNGEVTSYGNQVPMVGVDFFIGPKHDTFINGVYKILDTLDMTVFNYFNNGNSRVGNPNGALEIFRVMTGFNRVGDPLTDDRSAGASSSGYSGTGPRVRFAYPGNPNNPAEWSQCQCGLPKTEDRRFVHSSGPFTLYSGGTTNDLTIGMVWVSDVGACPNATFSRIRVADDLAQEFFDVKFRVIRGPDAPDMTIREGDRELIFYLTNNNPRSNNYQERYGRDTGAQFKEYAGSLARKTPDSLYKFEGYRVFQLKNSSVTAAQIFGENGEINEQLAVEVFQCDIQNGVTTIINHETRPEVGSNAFQDQIKVKGKDSGIVHSFRLTLDRFAKGNDSRFVNYHNYYFLAIAYAHNDFRTFTYALADSTQKRPYLESSLSWMPGNRLALLPIPAMPNPTNGAMGTETPSTYGTGVVIKRLEGNGNGRTFVQMDEASEDEALLASSGYQSKEPTYVPGQGPVNVKVVDPRKVQAFDWELWLTGHDTADGTTGLVAASSSWKLIRKDQNGNDAEVIYSDRSLDVINEQIIVDYGLSVTVNQVKRPGDDQINNNGLIGASVTFADVSKPWLSGVSDAEFSNPRNWIRSGGHSDTDKTCNYNDNNLDTVGQFYETLFSDRTLLKATWAPYALATNEIRATCGFGVASLNGQSSSLSTLPSIDLVLTSDKSKWTRCAVVELQDDPKMAEGGAAKFDLRKHLGWNMDISSGGSPVYSTAPEDSGTSWFPGYAINQITGKRVNIIFGEDSYLRAHNGNDMIWNPTATISGIQTMDVINGGKHYIYVTDSAYDECRGFVAAQRLAKSSGLPFPKNNALRTMQWVGLPTLAPGFSLRSLADGLIPTETRLRFRVEMPFRKYLPAGLVAKNDGFPRYMFTTRDIAVRPLGATDNTNDRDALLDRIRLVPNPYYGYSGYERDRLDNRVRITNLPNRATISIYSMDGTLIRRLEHVNNAETTKGYEDWDIRNAKGLQIASGMYLVHVKAEGMGETVIKWFGAMKPADVTDY